MLCALAREKAVRRYVDLNVKVFEENSGITLWNRMPIKDVQTWGQLRPKLDVCG